MSDTNSIPEVLSEPSAPLLNETENASPLEELTVGESDEHESHISHKSICKHLYASHFLSTWNSRAFEFGAFLFLATIYPQTLLPASIYALTRAGAAATLSPWLGGYIDRGDRLAVVRLSIIGQRLSVAVSCVILFCMCQFESIQASKTFSYSALAILSVLACVEKLAAVLNTISVERDWVVIIAGGDDDRLRTMNSQMRRIDLFCKLVAPLFISLIDSSSSKIAILTTGAMTAVSVLVEYFAIARVHTAVPALRVLKPTQATQQLQAGFLILIWKHLKDTASSTATYICHRAFLPSFSLALLYLTVLSFNGQMVTYLLAVGFNSAVIGILRGVSAIFELSATWLGPKIMRRIGPVRSGIWFINCEIIFVFIACLFLWVPDSGQRQLAATGATVAAVIASRIGLWGFDLSAQIIVQEDVEPELRGTFSSQEFAFQNIFEMLSFASTIIFSEPAQFKIPATISAGAVGTAGILYAAFVRSRRGHLVHLSRCMERSGKFHGTQHNSSWQRLSQGEGDEVVL